MKNILIIGGGGHGRVLISLIKALRKYEITGILDPHFKPGALVAGVPILGNDDMLPELFRSGIKNACIGVGSVKDNYKRKMVFQRVKEIGYIVPPLIHPKAFITEGVEVLEGAQIMAGSIIQRDSYIGENTIINTGAIVEHDCKIGPHSHVASGAILAGECVVNDGAFIGAGSTIIQGIRIGANSVIAAGAVVLKNVEKGKVVAGVPAKTKNASKNKGDL